MHTKRYGCAAAVMDGKLYVVGGHEGEVYDPTTQQWTVLNDMITTRRGSAAVSLEGRIVVIGGGDGVFHDFSSCEVYDPETQKWTHKLA
eukprot:CAMPEP_0185730184 /NCGR_PEP_ID=MMETSP1171-20130828/8784_1 /TAXON_ID=374046 /ORGANISM="Helicotheca tamensis, Strain CCMP826" /LENGTH=88 /DNA_ID=CAMNT_0028399183 /DNA_START=24 /DNA_END=287 /DNA_ORIENTATION=+